MTLFHSFDESEFEDKDEQQTESDPIDELAQEDEVLDEEMDEAEQRINLAGYYRQLARGGIFKDGSEEARIVDAEVRQFARERMAVLLNLPSAPKQKVEMPFSEEQVAALQQWANRIIEKQNSLGQPQMASPKPPQLPAPAPQKAPTPTISSPTPPPTAANKKPAKKPKQSAPKPQAPKKSAKVTVATEENYDSIPDGQPFEVDGKMYKWFTNGEGRRLKIKITAPQIGAGAPMHGAPMPSAHAMAALSAAKAYEDMATTPAATSEKIQAAAALSILKQE